MALGAEVGATIADSDALNGGAAVRAEFTAKTVGNLKLEVGCPQFTARTKVSIHTSPLIANG